MIPHRSRYDAQSVYVAAGRTGDPQATVLRAVIPGFSDGDFDIHIWKEGDRLDSVASHAVRDPSRWWSVLDLNPEILDPTNIPVGWPVRVPRR